VTFSVADLNNMDTEADFGDRALGDEEDVEAETTGTEAGGDKAGEGEEAEPSDEQSFPVRLNVVIERAGRGALGVEAVAQDGMIVIDNVFHYGDAALAYARTAELAHARQEAYVGPPFGNLDEDLQVLLERYLDERGVNAALARFVPAYVDLKEQREYLKWLENVKGFVQ
jgi:complement component 1 Q subcomponent-binding protein